MECLHYKIAILYYLNPLIHLGCREIYCIVMHHYSICNGSDEIIVNQNIHKHMYCKINGHIAHICDTKAVPRNYIWNLIDLEQICVVSKAIYSVYVGLSVQ